MAPPPHRLLLFVGDIHNSQKIRKGSKENSIIVLMKNTHYNVNRTSLFYFLFVLSYAGLFSYVHLWYVNIWM